MTTPVSEYDIAVAVTKKRINNLTKDKQDKDERLSMTLALARLAAQVKKDPTVDGATPEDVFENIIPRYKEEYEVQFAEIMSRKPTAAEWLMFINVFLSPDYQPIQ
jgi:hypothetical protein